jgi:hypothetical protein
MTKNSKNSETPTKNTISQIIRLINDPLFAEFQELQRAPSIFNVVGRTHTETWHSAMLGWLLNPKSSHGLGEFALRRFIILMMAKDSGKVEREIRLQDLLIAGDFSDAESLPNEFKPFEVQVQAVSSEHNKNGRLDVFVRGIRYIDDTERDVSILVEMKVNDSIKAHQCQKYITYIQNRKSEGIYIYPVYVTPDWNLIADDKTLFGSEEWIVIDFQALYEDVIAPSLNHRQLSEFGRVTLTEYVKTLKYRNERKGNQRMAITQEEREVAGQLLEKYGEAIQALLEVLNPDSEVVETLASRGEKRKAITLDINGKAQLSGDSIRKLYRAALEYLVDNHLLDNFELPYATSSSRYFLATSDEHPSGIKFFAPVDYKGLYMEANKSREGGVRDLIRLFAKLNIDAKQVSG